MNAGDRLRRNSFLAVAPGGDGYLAYDVESRKLHRLNPAAAMIVELCDGTRNAAEVCSKLTPILGPAGPEACARWIETARAEGVLKSAEAGAPFPAGPSADDLVSLAWQLRDEGWVLAAFVCQHHATLLAPDDAEQWRVLGELAHIVGRREDAREAYERYLAFQPDDAEIEHLLVSLRDEPPPPRAPDRSIEQLYARFAEFYEDNMCGDLDYQAPARLSEAIDAELGTLGDLDILDLGCGTGLAGRYLRSRSRHLVGIDLSPEMISHAQAAGLYDVLEVAEITAWLSRPGGPHFTLIAACDTLIYFGDLRQVLVPAARRIHPGGWLAFTLERGETTPFRLTDSGRYAHSAAHVIEVAGEAEFLVGRMSESVLRYEYGEPVIGLVVVLWRQ